MSRNLKRTFMYLFFMYALIFNYAHADNKNL